MSEYMKKKQAVQPTQTKKTEQLNPMPQMTGGIPNSVLTDVFAGKRQADSSMMGHSQNLAPSIAAKMSRAFGMDLTGMQVYRSDAMAGTGMRGMAQGNKVVLSSDVDLNTTAGQAVLGHEISHIHAQSQGTGMGHSGLYENAALEHQADTEGLLAAQGRSIYSDGMDTGVGMSYGLGMQGVEGLTSLSGGMSASAGAPMQAKKDDTMKVNTGLLKKPGKKMGLLDRMEKFRMGFLQKQFGVSDEDLSKMKKRKKTTQLERVAKLLGGNSHEYVANPYVGENASANQFSSYEGEGGVNPFGNSHEYVANPYVGENASTNQFSYGGEGGVNPFGDENEFADPFGKDNEFADPFADEEKKKKK